MKVVVRQGAREVEVEVEALDHGYRLTLDDTIYEVDVAATGDAGVPVKSLLIDGQQHEVAVRSLGNGDYWVSTAAGTETIEVMDPLAFLAEQASGGKKQGPARVLAVMPGVVKKVLVAEGDAVTAGQALGVLEAMKMENEIEAEGDGTVTTVAVGEGQAVDGGELLFEIE